MTATVRWPCCVRRQRLMRVLWGRLAARRGSTGRGVVAYTSWPMPAPRIINECVNPDWIADSVSSIPLMLGGHTGPAGRWRCAV